MVPLTLALVLLGALPASTPLGTSQEKSEPSPARKVNVANTRYLQAPNWRSDEAGKAQDGDDVTVLGVEGNYSKVQVKRLNLTAWIESALLVPPEKFVRSASDEKEGQKYSGQAAEASRGVNEPMEKEYRSAGGAAVEQSYKDLESLLARRLVAGDRAKMVARLKEFQQEGKLGDHSPVK